MLIIGEKLNSSIPSVKKLMDANDTEGLIALIEKQRDAGAEYLDVNTALCENEAEMMKQIISLIIARTSCGIVLDSPDPRIILDAIPLCGDRPVIVNSVTPTDRFDALVPALANKYPSVGVVALPIDVEDRDALDAFIQRLTDAGISPDRIYMDLLIESVATNDIAGKHALDTLVYIKHSYPALKTTCGLSNIAFGLPSRHTVNTAFFALASALGLDSAIMDPTAPSMRKTISAIRLLSGEDEYCMDYITCIQELEG